MKRLWIAIQWVTEITLFTTSIALIFCIPIVVIPFILGYLTHSVGVLAVLSAINGLITLIFLITPTEEKS